MKKFGHRNTLCGGLIFGGIASLVTGLVPDGNQQSINFSLFLLQSPSFVELDPPVIRIVFSLIGKFFITCVLAVNFSYTIELFPTSTRNAVVGLCSTMDKVGGILAPSLAGIVIKQLILTLQHISDEFFLGFFFFNHFPSLLLFFQGRMVNQSMPFIIFAIANIVIGSLCMMLPETSNSPLPTTIKEAEDIEKSVT